MAKRKTKRAAAAIGTRGLLEVEGLQVWFDAPEGVVRAVDGVSFSIGRGETLALLGESGCGKSITALALTRLVPAPAGRIVNGSVRLDGEDLLRRTERDMRAVRGRRIAMIFQEPQTALNPVLTVGEQIGEVLPAGLARNAARARIIDWLKRVGMSDPERRLDQYPHELSGGMKQRAMIAMALAAEPELLIADEPTTALDVTIQAQILDLLAELKAKTGMAMLFITHDLAVVSRFADRLAVMYAGQIVETAPAAAFFAGTRHPYAHKLMRAIPGRTKRGAALEVIRGGVPSLAQEFSGCRFAERCDAAWERCRREPPGWWESSGHGALCHLYDPSERRRGIPAASSVTPVAAAVSGPEAAQEPLLQVSDLRVYFPVRRGVLRRVVAQVRAVDGVDFAIRAGRTLALVGESGCGKTTVGKGILQLIRPTAGTVEFAGQDLTELGMRQLRPLRRDFQVVFQDPFASLNPRMLVSAILEEGMRALGLGDDRGARRRRAAQLLAQVGLPATALDRYPHEFSGGQRQRLCIARALAVEPRLIICDEPTSALDVSVQAQILNLLLELQRDLGLSYLFITHNLAVVEYLAHEVAVMYLGRIVETGTVQEILESPRHPYTAALLASAPVLATSDDGGRPRPALRLAGDIPSPVNPPSGCHFHPRCPKAMPECRQAYPGVTQSSATHRVACWLYGAGTAG